MPQLQEISRENEIGLLGTDRLNMTGRLCSVVEDGPTLTHGGMGYGAGKIAAEQYDAGELVDPRPSAVGSIAATLRAYPHITDVLPALGYSARHCDELTRTIENSGAGVVIDASPGSLDRMLKLSLPVVRVRYKSHQIAGPSLGYLVDQFVAAQSAAR